MSTGPTPGIELAMGTAPRPVAGPARPVISLRVIVTSVALAITAGAMLGVGAVAERNARRALTSEVEARLFLEARNLARASTPALLGDFPELVLHPMLKELQAERAELELVTVVDHGSRIQGDPDVRRLGEAFTPPESLEPVHALTELRAHESFSGNRELLVVSVPVADASGRSLGTAWVGLRRSHVERLLSEARKQVVLILGIALALGMAATFAIMTWLLRPVDSLREGLERIGRGDLETPLQVRDQTELGMLAQAVNRMAGELKEAQIALVEKERLAHELELAREIQRSLLPTRQVRVGSYLIDGTQESAREVGGDYYDFFPLEGGKVGAAIADVSGKGLAGCVVMSMLSALLRSYKDDQPSPSELLAQLDSKLAAILRPGTFVTMFYGVLDPEAGTLTYASAAHCPTLVFRRSTRSIEAEPSTGIPLGAIRGGKIRSTLRDHTVHLQPGDMIVQYTDGVNESFDPQRREQFGFARLEQVVIDRAEEGWPAVLSGLRRELIAFRADGPRDDDETLLVIARDPEAGEVMRSSVGGPTIAAGARVEPLVLPAQMESLARLGAWLRTCPGVDALDPSEYSVLTTALYEACANIVEHGYGDEPERQIRLDCVQAPTGSLIPDDNPLSHMEFAIQDQGRPFHADKWRGSDFNDPEVRRRGRGFGLDIIHRAMVHVEYRPGTPEGNITLLVFDPAKHAKERKLRYA